MSLSRRSIGRPVAVAMLFIAIALLGILSASRLPIDLLPDIAYPKLVVYTEYPGVGPAEVERFVTEPVEQRLAQVRGRERTESVSREGVSLVTLRFAWGTDMDFAVLNVREQLDNLRDQLPEQATRPVVLRTDPTADPIMAITLAGADNLWSLKELGESVLRRRLEQVDGVAQAAVVGGLEREIHVDVDPQKLRSYGITLDEVSAALAAANRSAPGGTIRRGNFRYTLRTLGEFTDVAEIADVVIPRAGDASAAQGASGSQVPASSRAIRIRDIAIVDDGFRERESISRYDGEPAVGLLLFKEAGANTVRVAERVDVVLEQLRNQYPELRIEVATSQAGFISAAIDNLISQVISGGMLAFLVLFLFLRDPRVPVAISLAMPISLLATFALFDLFGITFNIMSLGGLALGVGMLADNSIVVVENIYRHRELGLSAREAAAVGTEEVTRAIIASTLTTIAVFGPIVYVEGVAGQLFGSLSFAVAFSLATTIMVSLTVLPVMAARWDSNEEGKGPGFLARAFRPIGALLRPLLDGFERGFVRFQGWYEGILRWSLHRRSAVVGGALLLLALSVPVALSLPRSVLPTVDQGSFRIDLELPRGTPIEQTSDAAGRLESVLLADEDVAAVFTLVGRQAAIAGVEDVSGLHTARLDVRLHDGVRTAGVIERFRGQLDPSLESRLTIDDGTATALGRLLGGGVADLAVRVRGEDKDAALALAGQIEARLQDVAEVTNVRQAISMGHPEVRVEIDRDRAAAFGVTPRQVADAIDRTMRGSTATEYVDFDRKIPIVVRLPESARTDLSTLDHVTLAGVPLREFVRVVDAVAPTETRRVDQSPVISVFADVARGGVDGAVDAIRAGLAGLEIPRGLELEIGGENEEMTRSFSVLIFAILLAILLVYMILAAEFESLIHPFTILLSVPLGAIGAVLALGLTGSGLNVVSLIGLVVLIGIVDNDAVIMVDFINQRRAAGLGVMDAIREAGHARLRPILITSITTMLGVLPMAIGLGSGAELQRPLAIAVAGGLFTATALTLIVIPVVYSLVEQLRERFAQPAAASDLVPSGVSGD